MRTLPLYPVHLRVPVPPTPMVSSVRQAVNFCSKFNSLGTHRAIIMRYLTFSRIIDSILIPNSVGTFLTFILSSSKMSYSTRQMFSGVMVVCSQRSCGSFSTVSRPSLNFFFTLKTNANTLRNGGFHLKFTHGRSTRVKRALPTGTMPNYS